MVHLAGSNSTAELKRQFSEGLNTIYGTQYRPKLNWELTNAIRIFQTTKRIHWDHRWMRYWPKYGFHYVYIVTEAIDAELEPLMELVELDKQMGYTCDKLDLEIFIFRFKALKIIVEEEVRNSQSVI